MKTPDANARGEGRPYTRPTGAVNARVRRRVDRTVDRRAAALSR
jgi:hypothetical protein